MQRLIFLLAYNSQIEYLMEEDLYTIIDKMNLIPLNKGYYDTYNYSPAGLYDGAWGTFPYFDSDKIVIYTIPNANTIKVGTEVICRNGELNK